MSSFRLSRRAVLRGAGSIAIALPWLEIMHEERKARAAAAAAKRFIAVYTPGGTVHADAATPEQWSPIGTETDFKLSRILTPYSPVKSQLIVLGGIDMKSANGEQQQSGVAGWLTGTAQVATNSGLGYAGGPSIDQVLNARLIEGRPLDSLELAVRWGTGKALGRVTPAGVVSFKDDARYTPRPPLIDPVAIWKKLFGALDVSVGSASNWDKSVLDYVDRRYAALSGKLGASDKQRVDEHLTRIRELEMSVAASVGARCRPPTLIDTSDYNPNAGQTSTYDATASDLVTDAAIPKVGKLMLDMLVMALAVSRPRSQASCGPIVRPDTPIPG